MGRTLIPRLRNLAIAFPQLGCASTLTSRTEHCVEPPTTVQDLIKNGLDPTTLWTLNVQDPLNMGLPISGSEILM